MPRISEFYGIIILMYFNEHYPLHFHARYNEYEAVVDIRQLKIIKGTLPPRALKLVVEWGKLHQQELLENWELMQAGKPWKKITPLK